MTSVILALLPMSLFLCVLVGLKYFYNEALADMLLNPPIYVTILVCIFFILCFIVSIELTLRSQDQDERLLAIDHKASTATLFAFIGSLFCLNVFFKMVLGWQTITLNVDQLPFMVIALMGCLYSIAFAYYYFKMS
jgi:hypothetical protein